MIQDAGRPLGSSNRKPAAKATKDNDRLGVYASLLKNEVLGYQIEDCKDVTPEKKLTPNRKLFNVSYNPNRGQGIASSKSKISVISKISNGL